MDRKDEFARMRAEEGAQPLPLELAYLESRVKARAAQHSPRRKKGRALAAVCLCLVLATAMAWGGGFGPLAQLLGHESEQLLPFYQPIGEVMEMEGGSVTVEGAVFTTESCSVLYKIVTDSPRGQELPYDMMHQFSSSLLRMDVPGEHPLFGPGRRITAGWSFEWLESSEPNTIYHLEMSDLKESLVPEAPYELHVSCYGGKDQYRTLVVPVEEIFEEIRIETPESRYFNSISLSPALFHGEAIMNVSGNPSLDKNPDLELVYVDGSRWTMGKEQLLYEGGRLGPCLSQDYNVNLMTWHLRETPPDLENLAGIELDGVYYPVKQG